MYHLVFQRKLYPVKTAVDVFIKILTGSNRERPALEGYFIRYHTLTAKMSTSYLVQTS